MRIRWNYKRNRVRKSSSEKVAFFAGIPFRLVKRIRSGIRNGGSQRNVDGGTVLYAGPQKVEVGAFHFNYSGMLCKKIAVMLLSAYNQSVTCRALVKSGFPYSCSCSFKISPIRVTTEAGDRICTPVPRPMIQPRNWSLGIASTQAVKYPFFPGIRRGSIPKKSRSAFCNPGKRKCRLFKTVYYLNKESTCMELISKRCFPF